MTGIDYSTLRDAAVDIAREAGELTRSYFRRGVAVDTKDDLSPVTVADREAERLMRYLIEKRFPDHGIIGEEYGKTREDAETVWVLDPIDGTRSFVAGVPLFTNLVGVLHRGESVVGVINAPAMGECVDAAIGGGCRWNGVPTEVAEADDVDRSLALTSSTGTLYQLQPEFCCAYLARFPFHRTWADGYGYLMVATGRAQAMVDAVLELWDAAALLPVITEAGGIYTSWGGEATIHSRCAVAATPAVYPEVMELVRRHGRPGDA